MKKSYLTVCLMAFFLIGMMTWNVFGEKKTYSESERRVLAKFPKVTSSFSDEFEEYAVDTFPIRDTWRSIKAYFKTAILLQKDNNGIYQAEGHLSKMEYPMNADMVKHVAEVLNQVKESYLLEQEIYLAVIPDKNRYLAEKNGYLSMNYDRLSEYLQTEIKDATYIEIADLLSADDYYKTDTHWRQEKLMDVAERIALSMGSEVTKDYRIENLDVPFHGVYVGQSALKCKPDEISYVTNDVIDRMIIDGATAVYDMDKAYGKDAYEMFLSGNQPVITMKDPQNVSGKRLIMFRDSFGSSIAPLFMSGYSEIVLVDLRYISSDMLGEYVNFENADVLFFYSTLMLNNSLGIR